MMLRTLCRRMVIILCALLFLQVPAFFVHYEAHLSGHVAELKLIIPMLERDASKEAHPRGNTLCHTLQARYERLSDALAQVREANSFSKPFLFLWNIDWNIFFEAAKTFSPGVIITRASLFWAGVGCAFGWALMRLFSVFLRAAFACVRRSLSPAK